MNTAIGNALRQRMQELGVTQTWLAEQLDVSVNAVSKWCRGEPISRQNAVAVAQVLDLNLDELLATGAERKKVEALDASREFDLVYLNRREIKLLTLYRESTSDGKRIIELTATAAPKQATDQ